MIIELKSRRLVSCSNISTVANRKNRCIYSTVVLVVVVVVVVVSLSEEVVF